MKISCITIYHQICARKRANHINLRTIVANEYSAYGTYEKRRQGIQNEDGQITA